MEDSSDNKPALHVKKPADLTPVELVYLHEQAFKALKLFAEIGSNAEEGNAIENFMDRMSNIASDIREKIAAIESLWADVPSNAEITTAEKSTASASQDMALPGKPYQEFLADHRRITAYWELGRKYRETPFDQLPPRHQQYYKEREAAIDLLRIVRLYERAAARELYIKDKNGVLLPFDGKSGTGSSDNTPYTASGDEVGKGSDMFLDVGFNGTSQGKATLSDLRFERLVDAANRFLTQASLPLPLNDIRNLFPDLEINDGRIRFLPPESNQTAAAREKRRREASHPERGRE